MPVPSHSRALLSRALRGCIRCGNHNCTRVTVALLLACAPIGCGTASDAGPTAPPGQVFTTLKVAPDRATVDAGDEFYVTIWTLDADGAWVTDYPRAITVYSDPPSVASVDASGQGIALAPGSAVISVKATIHGITKTATTHVDVVAPTILDSVVFTLVRTAQGYPASWTPARPKVIAGGTVRWTGLDGFPEVYLIGPTSLQIVDSVAVSNGSASRSFATPGKIRFCVPRICANLEDGASGILTVH